MSKPPDDLHKKSTEQRRRLDILAERLREGRRSHWKGLSGPALDMMLADQEAAERSLFDTNPHVRRCAADVLVEHWNTRPGDEATEKIHRLALTDADREVRAAVLISLARCYRDTDDVSVGKSLASILRDDTEHTSVRESAYCALFIIRGLSLADVVKPTSPGDALFRIPDDINWPFVDSFLADGRTPSPANPLSNAIPNLSTADRACLKCFREVIRIYDNQQYDEGIGLLTQAIRVCPKASGAYYMRARGHLQLGRLDEAIQDFSEAITLSPESAQMRQERGAAYEQKGLLDLARLDYRKAAELRGEDR